MVLYSNLSKTSIVAFLLSSSIASAGTMGPICTPGSVTVPCNYTGWDFGADALYVKPSYSHSLGYVGTTNNTDGTVTSVVKNQADWNWGFKLEGAYHFNTGNDINLNWYHLVNKTSTVYANNIIGFGQRTMDTNVSAIEPQWDAVNLELGQHVDFGHVKQIRFHGGVQYAKLKTILKNTDTILVLGDYNRTIMESSNFGPRAGTDLSYNWDNGFAIYANTATAILVGNSRLNRTVANTNFPEFANKNYAKKTTIIPELEAKLGIKYAYLMDKGSLVVNVGYMWVNYFNALPTFIPFGPGVTNDHIANSNFGVQGPYAGLKLVSANL